MRLLLTVVAVVEGAAVLLVAAVVLRVGARPCRDVIVVQVAAACAPPMAASWALWAAPLLGGVLGLLVARTALGPRRPALGLGPG